jgi:hypothetical protein
VTSRTNRRSALLLLPAAGLLLYAGAAAYEATRLPHVGAWTMMLTSAVLGAAAASLLWRQVWAYLFSALWLAVTIAGYAVLAVVLAREGLASAGGGDWSGVRALAVLATATGCAFACVVSAIVAAAQGAAWRGIVTARSSVQWAAALVLVPAALGLVAWLVYGQYWQRQLFRQNQCLGGDAIQCYRLVTETERFKRAERETFALRGCEQGSDNVCVQLASLLSQAHSPGSRQVQAVAARCRAGNPQLCERLGSHFAQVGEWQQAEEFLTHACAIGVAWCDSAARVADENGRPALAVALGERGCERDDARACRGLFQRLQRQAPGADLAALERKLCLVGDVNDCRALMRRDLAGICGLLCAGTAENQWHSCGYCAKDAEAAGETALAASWLSLTCERGYRWGCRDLEQLRRRLAQRPTAVTGGG